MSNENDALELAALRELLGETIAQRDAVALELGRALAELEAIRTAQEHAQARLTGHPAYGSGSVSDEPSSVLARILERFDDLEAHGGREDG